MKRQCFSTKSIVSEDKTADFLIFGVYLYNSIPTINTLILIEKALVRLWIKYPFNTANPEAEDYQGSVPEAVVLATTRQFSSSRSFSSDQAVFQQP